MQYLTKGTRLSRDEKWLVFGQAISTVGDYMALPALLKLALGRGEGVTSLFVILYFLPRVAQPLLGIFVDAVNPKTLVLVAESTRALLFLGLYLCPADVPTLYWLMMPCVSAIFACLFEPARLKIMSQIGANFTHLTAVFYFFYSVTGIVSVAFSIVVETYCGTHVVFLINSATFVISFLMLCPINYQYKCADSVSSISLRTLFGAFQYYKKYRLLLLCTGAAIITDFFTGVLYELFPKKSIEIGYATYGTYIYTLLICLGNSLGSLAIAPVYQRKGLWPFLAAVTIGTAWLFLVSHNPLISFTTGLFFFVVQIIVMSMAEIAVEEVAPPTMQGQLFAINESLPILMLSLGSFVSGLLPAGSLTYLCLLGLFFYCSLYWHWRCATKRTPSAPQTRVLVGPRDPAE